MALSISPNVSSVDNKSGSLTATNILDTIKTVDGSTSGLDADLLDGSHRDTAYNSYGNGTIPIRHPSGYLYSNYFNCTADITATVPSHIAIQTSSDNFIRWQTTAQFKTNFGITALESTGLGLTGVVGLNTTTNTAAEWAALPVGYARMFATASLRGGVGTEGAPSTDYGYFFKVANRDNGSPNGWGGIWLDHSSNNFYYGKSFDGSTTASWNKLQNELVSGTNIKTINGNSVLGSGDLAVVPAIIRTYTEITPTNGQTVFTISYTVGLIDVYINGVKLHNTDFTASNGTSVTINYSSLTNTDVVGFNVYGAFNIANTVTFSGTETLYNKTLVAPKETLADLAAGNNIDCNSASYFKKTISGNTTFTVSNVATAGSVTSFILDLTNGGSATITWWANLKWQSGLAPVLTSSGRDSLGFYTHDNGTTWTGLVLAKDIK